MIRQLLRRRLCKALFERQAVRKVVVEIRRTEKAIGRNAYASDRTVSLSAAERERLTIPMYQFHKLDYATCYIITALY